MSQPVKLNKEFFPNFKKIEDFSKIFSKKEIEQFHTAFVFYDRTGR